MNLPWAVAPENLPQELKLLNTALQAGFPGEEIVFDGPTKGGYWFINLRWQDKILCIEWRPEQGFGLAVDPVFGEGATMVVGTPEEVAEQLKLICAVPEEIKEHIGRALSGQNLTKFWHEPNKLLAAISPHDLWQTGSEGQEAVRGLIASAKSGDMA